MKKMVLVFLFLMIAVLSADTVTQKHIWKQFENNQQKLLSSREHGTSLSFLPPNLAMAINCREYHPLYNEFYIWDMELSEWLHMYDYSYSYVDGDLSEMVVTIQMQGQTYTMATSFGWESGLLMETESTTTYMGLTNPGFRETYLYTDQQILSGFLLEAYEPANQEWLNIEQWNITIEDNKITMIVKDEYDYELFDWIPEDRHTYTWDEELIISEIEEYYDSGSWYYDHKKQIYYLAGGLMDYLLYQVWINNDWQDEHKTTYTYAGNLHTYDLTETWTGSEWVNDEQNFIDYDDQERPVLNHNDEFFEGEWMNESENHIFYSLDNPGSVIAIPDIKLFASPNPFNPSTTLCWQTDGYILPEKLIIYNLKGKKINALDVTTQADGSGNIIWQGTDAQGRNLPSGIYFFQLAGYHSASKIVILK